MLDKCDHTDDSSLDRRDIVWWRRLFPTLHGSYPFHQDQDKTVVDHTLYRPMIFTGRSRIVIPFITMLVMLGCYFLIGAIFPLAGVAVHQIFPGTPLEHWLLAPTQYLFPSLLQIPAGKTTLFSLPLDWVPFLLLAGSFVLLFVCYLAGLRFLPAMVARRFILCSTALLGLVCVLYPSIPSVDIFSYISYARLEVIYHLNPLIATPRMIPHDPIFKLVYWKDQPSAYGPTWIFITAGFQWLTLFFAQGIQNIFLMVIALRCFGLIVHLCSTQLIWVISGSLQHKTGQISTRQRALATLAFAWNPLLLLEAVAMAHNDTIVLFFVLLALWSLQRYRPGRADTYMLATLFLALAACLKITYLVLAPGLVLFLWMSREQAEALTRETVRIRWRWLYRVIMASALYVGTIVILYLSFWQHGAILHVVQVNPGLARDVNSPYEFIVNFYQSLRHRPYPVLPVGEGIPLEKASHSFSLVLYCIVFCLVTFFVLLRRQEQALVTCIQWMATVWLLYCLVGSPWLWPWYFIVFFGLFALLESVQRYSHWLSAVLQVPLAARLLAFAILLLYAFITGATQKTTILLPYFEIAYLRGLLLCIIPLLALHPYTKGHSTATNVQKSDTGMLKET